MINFSDFINFLAEYHCLGRYWSNLEEDCTVTGLRHFNQHLEAIFRAAPRFWLQQSFYWAISKEGFTYWAGINDYWCKRCREMNGL